LTSDTVVYAAVSIVIVDIAAFLVVIVEDILVAGVGGHGEFLCGWRRGHGDGGRRSLSLVGRHGGRRVIRRGEDRLRMQGDAMRECCGVQREGRQWRATIAR
jgi:hypothetical protein